MIRRLTPTLAAFATGRTISPLWTAPNGRAFYPIAGGAEDTPPADPAAPTSEDPKPKASPSEGEDKKFTQADVDRIIAGRFAKFADYDDVKKQLADLQSASATEQEKAVKAARDEGRTEALTETATKLVSAEFKAAAKGRMEPAALAALLEDLDLSKFLDPKGEVDLERIEKKVTALAPEPGPNKPPLGGGARKTEAPEPKPGLDRLRHAYAAAGTK